MPAAPSPNYLGANIATARKAFDQGKGMTQLALAHALGWKGDDAGAHVSHIESGKVEPKLSTLQKIAKVLAVSLDELLTQK